MSLGIDWKVPVYYRGGEAPLLYPWLLLVIGSHLFRFAIATIATIATPIPTQACGAHLNRRQLIKWHTCQWAMETGPNECSEVKLFDGEEEVEADLAVFHRLGDVCMLTGRTHTNRP